MNEAAAQEVQMILVIDRHIEFCSGCFACMQNGGVCRHNDDMRSILDTFLPVIFCCSASHFTATECLQC